MQYFSSNHTYSISQAMRPALGASRYQANNLPALSKDTHVGAALSPSLSLKGPVSKSRNWRGTILLGLINSRGKEIIKLSVWTQVPLSHIPTICLELKFLSASLRPWIFLCLHLALSLCLNFLDSIIPLLCHVPNTDW